MTVTSRQPRVQDLADALRELVETPGPGVRGTARLLNVAHSTVSQWINARRIPDVDDVTALLDALDVQGAKRDEVLVIARAAAENSYLATGVSEQLAAVLDNERQAKMITDWSPLLIPGMLQTSNYARAVFGSGPEVETRVAVRMGRRDALTRSNPVELIAIIHVAALLQNIGGASVMSEQLAHLLKMAELPAVQLLAVPNEANWHPGLLGPFVLYAFENRRSVVHLEHHKSGVFLYDKVDVDAYKVAAQEVREVAMSAEDTAALIAEILNSKWR